VDRLYAYLVSTLLLAAVLYPASLDPEDDSFPLSTYPMFSRERPRTASITSALALGAGGFERAVPPRYVANAETMQALQTLSKAVAAGPKQADRLCRAIAARLAEDRDSGFAAATVITLVTQTVDSIRYLAGEHGALARVTHARCAVPTGRP
jgi:hypothetical protein